MHRVSDEDDQGDLAGVRQEERNLGGPSGAEGHAGAPHQSEYAAEVLEEQCDITCDDERPDGGGFVAERRTVSDQSGDERGDEVAAEIANSWAAKRGDDGAAAGEDRQGEADEEEDCSWLLYTSPSPRDS